MNRRLALLAAPAAALAALAMLAPADRGSAGLIHQARGKQCIALHAIRTETALDDSRLIFHMNGGAAFINHLPQPCEGLRSVNTLSDVKLIPRGIDLCAGDAVAIVDHGSVMSVVGLGGSDTTAAPCKLGRFESASEMEFPESLRR